MNDLAVEDVILADVVLDGHRYIVISIDGSEANCSAPSNSRYNAGCHCPGCRRAHAGVERASYHRVRAAR